MKDVSPKLVVPDTTRRDAVIAIIAGLSVFAFVSYGIIHMSRPVVGNRLTGIVVGKQFTPQKEQQIDFSGRRLEAVKEIDGEYLLKVRVDPEKRVYEVPVEKPVFESHAEGDSLSFIRPRSEQR